MEEKRGAAAADKNVSEDSKKEKEFSTKFPPGYRFVPLDEELILDYLKPKMSGQVLPLNLMHEVNIYLHNPHYLTANFEAQGDKIWYYFTTRYKKYKNGSRPNRKAGNGYWKATGADKMIKNNKKEVIGYRKALVFYEGNPPKGDKTHWIMHEFRVDGPQPPLNEEETKNDVNNMKLDYVLCRIYKKDESSVSKGKFRVIKKGGLMEDEEKTSTIEDDTNDPPSIDVFSDMNNQNGNNTLFDTGSTEISYDMPMNHSSYIYNFNYNNSNNMHSDFLYGNQQYVYPNQLVLPKDEPSFFDYTQPCLSNHIQYDGNDEFFLDTNKLFYIPSSEISMVDTVLQPSQCMALPQQTHQENVKFKG